MRSRPIAWWLLLGASLAAGGCNGHDDAPRLAPNEIAWADQSHVALLVDGLAPVEFLEADEGRLRLAHDFVAHIGGAPVHVQSADGRGITVTLGATLPSGWHTLDLEARGRRWTVPNALLVDPDGAGDGGTIDATTPPALCPADPTLVGCWPLDGSGTDHGARGNDLTATSVVWLAGGGVGVDATSGLSAPARPGLRHGTVAIEAWVRVDVLPVTGRAGVADHEGQFGVFVGPGGELRCSGGLIGAGTISVPAAIRATEWHHVACTYDAGELVLYLDGAPIGTTPASATGVPIDGALDLGENSPTGDDQLVGALDDVRLWDRPRTRAELAASFASGRVLLP